MREVTEGGGKNRTDTCKDSVDELTKDFRGDRPAYHSFLRNI